MRLVPEPREPRAWGKTMKLHPSDHAIAKAIHSLAVAGKPAHHDKVAEITGYALETVKSGFTRVQRGGLIVQEDAGEQMVRYRHVGSGLATPPQPWRKGIGQSAFTERVYEMLYYVATRGGATPYATEIAEIVGHQGASAVYKALARLQDEGKIERLGNQHARQYRIAATGRCTAVRVRDDAPVVHPTHRPGTALGAQAEMAPRVEKHACGYCGLPSTVGMHSRCGSSRAVDYVALPRAMRPVFAAYRVGQNAGGAA